MSKLEPKEKSRRKALKLAKALDYYCPVCNAHEGYPCQGTGLSKKPGVALKAPHKHRRMRAFGYLAVHRWVSPGVAAGETKLFTGLAQAEWLRYLEAH
jgi:hypothetical protein